MNSGFSIQSQDKKSSNQRPSRPKKRKKLNECSILEEAEKVLLLERIRWLRYVVLALNILTFGLVDLTYSWNNRVCKWSYRKAESYRTATHIVVTSKDHEESLHEMMVEREKSRESWSFEYRHVVYAYSVSKDDFISIHTNWLISNTEIHAMRDGLTNNGVARIRKIFGRPVSN